jgi:hypothetical protein
VFCEDQLKAYLLQFSTVAQLRVITEHKVRILLVSWPWAYRLINFLMSDWSINTLYIYASKHIDYIELVAFPIWLPDELLYQPCIQFQVLVMSCRAMPGL